MRQYERKDWQAGLIFFHLTIFQDQEIDKKFV